MSSRESQAGIDDKIETDLRYLMALFREILEDLGEPDLASRITWREADRRGAEPPLDSYRTAPSYSMTFRLLGMVEENAQAQSRRKLEVDAGLAQSAGTWGANLQGLKEMGLSAAQVAKGLSRVRVEPVLTAHPTEAKRQTVLEHYRELYLLIVKRANVMWTPFEREAITEEIKATLERLWRTGDICLEKPDVSSELRNIIHYLRDVFPTVPPDLDRRLRQAWADSGFDPALLSDPLKLPRVSFGTWVGGDRDGHPLVDAEVTRHALDELRVNALSLLLSTKKTPWRGACSRTTFGYWLEWHWPKNKSERPPKRRPPKRSSRPS